MKSLTGKQVDLLKSIIKSGNPEEIGNKLIGVEKGLGKLKPTKKPVEPKRMLELLIESLERREARLIKDILPYETKIMTNEDSISLIKMAGQLELVNQLLKEIRS